MSKGKKLVISLIKEKKQLKGGVRKTDTTPKSEKVPKDKEDCNDLVDDQTQKNSNNNPTDESSHVDENLNEIPRYEVNWQEAGPIGPSLVTVTKVIKQMPGDEPW